MFDKNKQLYTPLYDPDKVKKEKTGEIIKAKSPTLRKGHYLSYEEVQHYPDYAIVIPEPFVVVDFDYKEETEAILKMIDYYGWKCSIMKTDRGVHLWFKSQDPLPSKREICFAGFTIDIKSYGKDNKAKWKGNGIEREWLKWEDKPDFLPKELTPTNHPIIKEIGSPLGIGEGSRRDTLFKRLIPLSNANFLKDEAIELTIFLNSLYQEPLKKDELKGLFTDDSLWVTKEQVNKLSLKQHWFYKNKFYHQSFGDWFLTTYDCRTHQSNLYLRNQITGLYSMDSDFINAMITTDLPELTISQKKEAYEYIRLRAEKINESNYPKNQILLKNGFINLNVDSLNNLEFRSKTTAENFFTFRWNVNYNPDIDSNESVDYFLDSISGNDKEIRRLIEEFLGYCLRTDNAFEKALLLYGESGANGKSTLLKAFGNVIGNNNVSNLSLSQLQSRFDTAGLVDKVANIGSDIGSKIIETDVFKNLVTGDPIKAEVKYKNSFTFTNNAKLFFAANTLPTTPDKSGGFTRRWVMLPLTQDFSSDKKDPFLLEKLITEEAKSYWLNLAINGYFRILEQKGFSKCRKAERLLTEYYLKNNSVLEYLENEITYNSIIGKKLKIIYQEYKTFCNDFGFVPVGLPNFKNYTLTHYKTLEILREEVMGQYILSFQEKTEREN